MVSRRKLIAAVGTGLALPVGGVGYCSTNGCSGARNSLPGSPGSTINWRTETPVHRSETTTIAVDDSNWYIPTELGINALGKQDGNGWSRGLGTKVYEPFDSLHIVGKYLVGVAATDADSKNGWAALRLNGDRSSYHMVRWDGSQNLRSLTASPPVMVTRDGYKVRAYDLDQKKQLWKNTFKEAGVFTAGDGKLFIVAYSNKEETWVLGQGTVRDPDSNTGNIATFNFPDQTGPPFRGAVYHRGVVYVFDTNQVAAVTPDGTVEWTYRFSTREEFRPLAFDGKMAEFVGGHMVLHGDRTVGVVSLSDGSVLWEETFDDGKYIEDCAATRRAVFVVVDTDTVIDSVTGTERKVVTYAHGSGEKLGERWFDERLLSITGSTETALLTGGKNRNQLISIEV